MPECVISREVFGMAFNKELLEQAVINANDAVVITEDKPELPIVYANAAFEKMTGYSYQEILGRHPGRLLQGPETNTFVRSEIGKKIKTDEPILAKMVNYKKNGEKYWVEMNIFPYQSGEEKYWISIQRDITERMELEEALMEYKEFFDESPVALVRTCLKSGKILMANKMAAQMLGFDTIPQLMENLRSTDLYSIKDRAKLISEIRKNGSITKYELKLTLPDGKEIWASANMHINCGGDCIEGSLIDITELVTLRNQQLKLAQQLSSDLNMRLESLE